MPDPADIEVIRRAIEQINATGEPDLELYDPEVVFVSRGELGGKETFEGHDGLLRGTGMFRDAWGQGIAIELAEVIEAADALVVVMRMTVKGTRSGVELELEESWATWMRDGRILRMEQYGSREEALAAAGVEPD